MDWKLEVVVVPVSDVDRAKHFYADQLGFTVDVDRQMNEQFRIVQITPPGSGCSITFGPGLSPSAPGSLKGLQLCVTDIEAAHAHLVKNGVEASEIQHFEDGQAKPGRGEEWNSFVFFDDPDGNSWTVQERP